jgi:hypothetical protein
MILYCKGGSCITNGCNVLCIVYEESTALTEVCVGLLNCMDLGETVPSVCSETGLTVTADGSEVSNIGAEEVLHTQ